MAWSKSTRISIMLAIDVVFFLVELITGFVVGSLALLADAFHMLNDIISLIVGLWAVTVAQKATTDKYSYGWLRAEILGAFFNAVFLIALCVSIILEALTRFLDPPEISNPVLILIVGCFGLASNLVGFLVLGGHGHSHGPGDGHSHGDDDGHEHVHDHGSENHLSAAEEGRAKTKNALVDEDGPIIEVLPEVALSRAQGGNTPVDTPRHIRFNSGPQASAERSTSRASGSRGRERRRASSLKHNRLTSIDDLSIHPASFRQNIIDASRPHLEESEESGDSLYEESAVDDEAIPDENSPLISTSNGKGKGAHNGAVYHATKDSSNHRSTSRRSRRDSGTHREHHHNQPHSKSTKKGHGHSHDDMGMNAMILHVIGDALGNVGVIVTALVIWLTDWPGRFYADPAVSLFITVIILRSCLPLTFATSKILLQATPDHIDVKDIKEDIQALPGVVSCHHVHIWQLSDTKVVASMHIQVAFPISEAGGEKYMALAKQARKCLHAYGIHSATIQPEFCLDHDYHVAEAAQGSLDGTVSPKCGTGENDLCLLECVDDCVGKGCCSVAPSVHTNTSRKSSHSRSSPHAHDHDHDHGHDHSHSHQH